MDLENFTGYVSTLSTLFEELNFTTASNVSLANATNATEFDDYDGNKFILPWWRQLIWSILYSGMVIVATGGNLIVIWIVLAHKRMRTVTNYFLLNLSIADAMVSTLNVIFNYIYMLNSHWPFGTLYCKIAQFTAILSVCASVFTLMAISIDRYMAIMNPLRPRMGRHMTLCIALGTWVVGSVLSCPSLLYFTTFTAGTRVICYAEWPDGPTNLSNQEYAYNVAFLVITYLLPIMAMTYAYARIGMELWGSQSIGECTQRQMENIKSKRRIRQNKTELHINYARDCKTDNDAQQKLYLTYFKYNRTTFAINLNWTVLEPADDDYNVHVELRKWGDGGWKQNLLNINEIKACSFMYKYAAVYWLHLLEAANIEKGCPIKPVVKMMIVVVVIFGVCWLPYHLYFIVTSYYPEITNSPYIQESYLAIYWLAMSNSMYNPIIYCWMNAKFRRGFQQFFSWCPCIHVTPEALTRREVLTSRHSISGSPDHHRIIKNDTQISRLHSVTYFAGTQTTVGDGYSTGTDTTSLDSKTGSGKRCHSYEMRPVS